MILNCYPVLKQIEGRPAMFTGELTLKSIHIYISGYHHALVEDKFELQSDPFHDWVASKLDYYESTAGWANMILAKCMGFEPREIDWNVMLETIPSKQQHLESIDMFYRMLEEFKNETDKQ